MKNVTDTNMVGLVLFGILSYATVIHGNIPIDPIINVTTTIIDTILTGSSPPDPPVQDTNVDNYNDTTIIVVPPIEIIPITTTDNPNDTTIIIGPIITSIPILPTNNNDSSSFESPANTCAYYGSGQCCPQLTPLAAPIGEVSLSYVLQYFYASLCKYCILRVLRVLMSNISYECLKTIQWLFSPIYLRLLVNQKTLNYIKQTVLTLST